MTLCHSVTVVKLLFVVMISASLLACQSTNPEENNRRTLADLANAQNDIEISSITLTRQQRADTLAKLYQTILTLEPDEEVRAQIEYRLVQMNTEAFEVLDEQALTDEQSLEKSDQALSALVASYQDLLTRFPDRDDNELMQYQLAKALDLQGKSKESLQQMEWLLAKYPESDYAAELNFRRADIYYNYQEYDAALDAYKAVAQTNNNGAYYVNSRYMSSWVLFKLNRLAEADVEFISLLDYLVETESTGKNQAEFSFDNLDGRYASLANDVQRVLSISLSQQKQAETLVSLTSTQKQLTNLAKYRHILFENLANFLVSNELKYDAELTYKAYIKMEPESLWAARYSIALLNLLEEQGKYSAARRLKQNYVKQFGLNSTFWRKAYTAQRDDLLTAKSLEEEVLPHLIRFSYQHSRRLYAGAQQIKENNARRKAFNNASEALATYLALVNLPQADYPKNKPKLSQSIIADELLFADASFESGQLQQALEAYQHIAYGKVIDVTLLLNEQKKKAQNLSLQQSNPVQSYADTSTAVVNQQVDKANAKIRLDAAYASTLTARAMLNVANVKATDTLLNQGLTVTQQTLLITRNQLDQMFVQNYPQDERVLTLASQAAQYAYHAKDYPLVEYYSHFILERHNVLPSKSLTAIAQKEHQAIAVNKLTATALKEVQIATQLQANSLYQQQHYATAELAYQRALGYISNKKKDEKSKRKELRELLASCIYLQGQNIVDEQPLLAVEHYLRIGQVVPESLYRLNAEFDAGNILLTQNKWRQGIEVLTRFKKRYPQHKYSRTISAKLAKAYENTGQWELAAEQLLLMINGPEAENFSVELKREAQYTAAEYYQKAGNSDKALTSYRTYAHQYPEPFVVAQEVRLKMSQFYQQRKDPNKQYFWYRKIVKYHDIKRRNSVSSITPRMEYLASFSALGLGKAHQQTFTWAKLKLPLMKSLKRKQSAMKLAIDYYQKVLSYQMAEFVPQASYNLATMYSQLASDILSSQRPNDLDELALEEYEFLLEDIAIPFEDKAIEIHANNAERSWQDVYDDWVEKSFSALAELDPAQYKKQERASHAVEAIY